MKPSLPLLMLFAACSALAQNSAILTSAGYQAPAPFQVAPGQVVTLFLHGLPAATDGTLRKSLATGRPLPALAGISLSVTQGQASPILAPIFAVRQENECGQSDVIDPACLLTAVKIEVPFEINGDIIPTDSFHYISAPAAMVSVEVDGRAGRAFPFQPIPDNAHVLTDCDVTWDTKSSSICNRHIYHADGRIVDETTPVKAGEAVSVYLYGLAQTSPPAQTGFESPAGAAVTDFLGHSRVAAWVQKDFYNALSSAPRAYPYPGSSPDTVPALITSAGLFRGQFGIYQVNITLPDVLSVTFPCGGDVHSNSILSIATSQGSEQIAMCVAQ